MFDRFTELAQRLRDFDASIFPGPASEEEIQQAEAELNVVFPNSYRWFLRTLGGADFPLEIFGLEPEWRLNEAASFWNVVYITQSERSESEPKMPTPLVPFTPDGMGNHLCLDTASMSKGECPVVFWNHDAGEAQRPRQTHPTFLDWLEERLASEEADYKNPSSR